MSCSLASDVVVCSVDSARGPGSARALGSVAGSARARTARCSPAGVVAAHSVAARRSVLPGREQEQEGLMHRACRGMLASLSWTHARSRLGIGCRQCYLPSKVEHSRTA